jgi:hypothetical protein
LRKAIWIKGLRRKALWVCSYALFTHWATSHRRSYTSRKDTPYSVTVYDPIICKCNLQYSLSPPPPPPPPESLPKFRGYPHTGDNSIQVGLKEDIIEIYSVTVYISISCKFTPPPLHPIVQRLESDPFWCQINSSGQITGSQPGKLRTFSD